MAKQYYIDENGTPIQVSGTVNTAELLPISGNDPTDTKTYIDTGLSGKANKTISSGSGQVGTSVSLIRLTVKEFNGIKFISGALQVTTAVSAGHLLCTIDNDFGRVDTNTWDIVGSSPSGSGVALYITNKVELRANTNLSANAVVVFNSWYI